MRPGRVPERRDIAPGYIGVLHSTPMYRLLCTPGYTPGSLLPGVCTAGTRGSALSAARTSWAQFLRSALGRWEKDSLLSFSC